MRLDIKENEVKKIASQILKKLIKINTTNPPGNELKAVQYLFKIAKENGLHAEIIKTDQNRGNIIISLNGKYNPQLVLLSHLDVVGANKEDWQKDPFSGIEENGWIWGRGTVDTKHLTVMELMTLILLKRNDIIPDQDIVLIATADEERGSDYGLKKLLDDHKTLFKDSLVISEGGGFPVMVEGKPFYLCETGQKGLSKIKITGKKNEEVSPFFPDNKSMSLNAKMVKKITNYQWRTKIPATTNKLIDTLINGYGLKNQKDLSIEEKLKILSNHLSPFMIKFITAMTKNTFAVTRWQGGEKNKELNNLSEIYIDCRVLPDVSLKMIKKRMEKILKNTDLDYEILDFSPGFESSYDNRLFKIFKKQIKKEIDESEVIPFISSGGSDGRLLQEFRATVYGFSPVLSDMTFEKIMPMVHGVDERISKDSLLFGTKILFRSVLDYLGGEISENR